MPGEEDEACCADGIMDFFGMIAMPLQQKQQQQSLAITSKRKNSTQEDMQKKGKHQRTNKFVHTKTVVIAPDAAPMANSLCCTHVVDEKSLANMHCLQLPRCKSQVAAPPRSHSAAGNNHSQAKLDAIAKCILSRESFLIKKACITRSVFLGLLHRGSKDPNFFVQLHPLEFSDGALFEIRDIKRVCIAVVSAWANLNTDPDAIHEQLHGILNHLESKSFPVLQSKNTAAAGKDNNSSKKKRGMECDEWWNFKAALKEAQILPLQLLVARMARNNQTIPQELLLIMQQQKNAAAGGERSNTPKKKVETDWHNQTHWFMSHLVEYTGMKREMKIKSYRDWSPLQHPHDMTAVQMQDEDCDEERNNNVQNDQTCVQGKHYFSSSGSSKPEAARKKRELTAEERKIKSAAGPFHPVVVQAAAQAIEEAWQYKEI